MNIFSIVTQNNEVCFSSDSKSEAEYYLEVNKYNIYGLELSLVEEVK